MPILGVIENMRYFQCPGCDTAHSLYGDTSHVTTLMGDTPLLASLPMVPRVVADCDQGTPSVISCEIMAGQFEHVVEQILPSLDLG